MPKYTASMQHNAQSIYKLAETQFNTFQFHKKIIRLLLALLLIFIGVFVRGNYFMPWACLIGGCILISSLNARPKYNARKICEGMKGKYPKSDYSFYDKGFKFYEKGELIPYARLICLVEDKNYFYLYVSKQSAYMVDRATVSGGDSNALRRFLSSRTGLDWKKPNTFLSFRFRTLSERYNEYEGERLG